MKKLLALTSLFFTSSHAIGNNLESITVARTGGGAHSYTIKLIQHEKLDDSMEIAGLMIVTDSCTIDGTHRKLTEREQSGTVGMLFYMPEILKDSPMFPTTNTDLWKVVTEYKKEDSITLAATAILEKTATLATESKYPNAKPILTGTWLHLQLTGEAGSTVELQSPLVIIDGKESPVISQLEQIGKEAAARVCQ